MFCVKARAPQHTSADSNRIANAASSVGSGMYATRFFSETIPEWLAYHLMHVACGFGLPVLARMPIMGQGWACGHAPYTVGIIPCT
jgi:hypothetical protein